MVTIKWRFAVEPPHKAFDRRWEKEEESWCSCDEDACHERTRARRPGRRGSEICKVSKRKFQLCQKNANSIFFWNPREWNAWLSVLCKVYSSRGAFCFGTSSRKYRRSKSAPAGVLHAVVWRRLAVSVERNRKNANSVFFVTESKVDISIWLCSRSFYPRELLEAIILKASPP